MPTVCNIYLLDQNSSQMNINFLDEEEDERDEKRKHVSKVLISIEMPIISIVIT